MAQANLSEVIRTMEAGASQLGKRSGAMSQGWNEAPGRWRKVRKSGRVGGLVTLDQVREWTLPLVSRRTSTPLTPLFEPSKIYCRLSTSRTAW